MGPTVESRSLTGNHPQHHRKGEKSYLHKLDQQDKVWATKAQQDWLINIVINNRLLDMQGIRVWRAKDTATSSWSLAFNVLVILIKSGIMFAPINYNMHKQAEHW
jgi:hypothetical protein